MNDDEGENDELLEWGAYDWATDDVYGEALDVKKVEEARREEMVFVKAIPVYEERPIEECYRKTGKRPIPTKWVDHNKGRGGAVDIRSRWVARDFKTKVEKDREDFFAGTPPLEAKKLLFKIAAKKMKGAKWGREKLKILFMDVRKAHLNAECDDQIYVELPEEAEAPGKCGLLKRWLYGMRGAAQGWEKHYTAKLLDVGFVQGRSSTVVFYHEQRKVWLVVHGDDFTFVGEDEELDFVQEKTKEWYDVKVRGRLGDDRGDDKEIVILNRTLRWDGGKLLYKADERHAQILMMELRLCDN